MTSAAAAAGYLQPGEAVDLTNCDREPIHIPGLIQPRGVLLALTDPGQVTVQASENVGALLHREVGDVLGRPLAHALGGPAAAAIAHHIESFGDLRERNPLTVTVDIDGDGVLMDAVLHRVHSGQAGDHALLIVELEPAVGPRPFSFQNTYQAVRKAAAGLSRDGSLPELYALAATEVQQLTGFDRVMIYRFDNDYNGEVVAESKRADLEPLLGLRYPASDIPAQARRLYEINWVRLIADVAYVPARILPVANPETGALLDLTHSTLRSVSPIHIEYLRNMGVQASMSISLLRDDRLWGLIACHHYHGPHSPPYGVRAAAEFLGATLSLRLTDRAEEDVNRVALASRSTLADLVEAIHREHVPLGVSLVTGNGLLDLVHADGVVVQAEGRVTTLGEVPAGEVVDRLLGYLRALDVETWATDSLSTAPGTAAWQLPPDVAGVLVVLLPDDQLIAWLRREVVHSVDWAGDPSSKTTAPTPDGSVRLSPRGSFAVWRETVRGRSEPWRADELANAGRLRGHLLEGLHHRDRRKRDAAETVQRSLLPAQLPNPPGWELSARYQPALGGQVGGDWYDALTLPDGRLAVVVGDAAGHGLETSGAMAQLRNGLRAYLLEPTGPAAAVQALDRLVTWTLPGNTATLVVALVDTRDGTVELVSAGHLPPFQLHADGRATELPLRSGLLLGVSPGELPTNTFTMAPGTGLALFTDGMVERRTESIDEGLDRLRLVLSGTDPARRLDAALRSRDPAAGDDATLVLLTRTAGPTTPESPHAVAR